MKQWVPLHCHSHYSLLDGLSKPQQIADRCEALGYTSCALTEHGNLAGCVDFMKALKKKKIKPILGCELYLSPQDPTIKDVTNGKHAHLCVLAKNLAGWRSLIQTVSYSNNPDFFYRKPRLSLEKLAPFAKDGNLIAFSGHMGSELANIVFAEPKLAYSATTYDAAKMLVHPEWEKRATELAGKYFEIFERS